MLCYEDNTINTIEMKITCDDFTYGTVIVSSDIITYDKNILEFNIINKKQQKCGKIEIRIFLIPFFENIKNPMSLEPLTIPKQFEFHDIVEGDMSGLICSTTKYYNTIYIFLLVIMRMKKKK